MSHLRRARLGRRPVSDHERARRLAAEDLHEPLGAEQAAWLGDHLADCPACSAVAAEYAAQREELRALPMAEPPRDLWARTSAALDAEQHRRASGRRLGFAVERRLVPYGALAGALVVAVVATASLFSTGVGLLGGPVQPAGSGAPSIVLPSVAAAPTPMTVSAANVAWLAPQDDGTYALNVAPVDQVCPPDAQPDCAPIDGSGRSVIMLSAAPRAVVKSPDRSQVVVVDQATRSQGGTVYVVPIAAPAASPSAGLSPTPLPIATAEATAEAPASPPASTGPSPSGEPSSPPGPTRPPEPSLPGPTTTPESSPSRAPGSPAASPSLGAVVAIATGVIVVGETAAYSQDGDWFAFTARPADGSHGPDIFVWHVGDAVAHPVTDDHASVFSAWSGSLILGSRAVPATEPAVDASPSPSAADGAVPGSSPEPGGSPPSSAPPSASPETAAPSASDAPTPDASSGTMATGGAPADLAASFATPTSFLLDPASGWRTDFGVAAWRPVPDPSGRYVVYWTGILRRDASTGLWDPTDGRLVIAPWSWLASASASASSGDDLVLPTASSSPSADAGASASPSGPFEPPSATPLPPVAAPDQAASPSPPGATVPPGSPEQPGSGSPSATPLPPLTMPEPLLVSETTGQAPPFEDWDVRWDPSGVHLAVWLGDPLDPTLGRLSLLTIDPASGQVDRSAEQLVDAPALPGFSIADGRVAWATPPGQDGEGSRLQVYAWTADAAGNVDSQPAMGPDEVIVVR